MRKIDAATGEVSKLTLVNGHIGSGCTLSKDGKTLYFSDTTENSVQQVDTSNGNVCQRLSVAIVGGRAVSFDWVWETFD